MTQKENEIIIVLCDYINELLDFIEPKKLSSEEKKKLIDIIDKYDYKIKVTLQKQ